MVTGTKLNARNLGYLVKIAESGSFSRASIVLGVTQSVLSRHVQELEAEAGTTIFHRTGRGLVETREGALIIEMARRILSDIEQVRELIDESKDFNPGRLRIGLIPSLAAIATVPLIRRLSEMLPDTRLLIQEAAGGTLVEWLNDSRLDIACLDDGPMLKRFNPIPIASNPLYLVCHRDDIRLPPETPVADLHRYPLVLSGKEHITRRQIEQVARSRNVTLNVVYESGSLWSVIKITDSGMAMGILPYLATFHPNWQRSKLIQPAVTRALCVATPLRQAPARSRRILEAVRDEIQNLQKQLGSQVTTPVPRGHQNP
ncbi:LysR family nitrogen assimilation transcriptional regulator [Pseudochelatococcus lubricantis]|uniref:LysR family nitrogen assimilation transcriptional regulator n=1 Tax=Pseudochelatococcus lubricantis TaxID=1538102 RepID=A0ABX0UTY1_9HYPH|nr:LysR family transcriptional regulator [Pseudochelatococcus lubricantis]NIJ56232.1 LysR family nitrogen assimilation transcriptional regulator [Pseudochelatococcus lubricantis]